MSRNLNPFQGRPRIFGRNGFGKEPENRPRFYLGTHQPNWLWQHPDQPYFVSDVRLRKIKRPKQTSVPWALDSGGFTEVMREGTWVTDPDEYAARIRRYQDEVTCLEWAAPQDWMCGEAPLKATGLTVAIHQERTIDSVLYLKAKDTRTHIAPVLQGQSAHDFLRHADAYEARGIDLAKEPRVGVGSVFNRQGEEAIGWLMRRLHHRGIKVHAFGFKRTGLLKVGPYLASADSISWSWEARRRPQHPDCRDAKHKACNNCYAHASRWLKALRAEVALDESVDLVVRRDGLGSPGPGPAG